MAKRILAYKFSLRPNARQRRALEAQLGEACRLYNAALFERRDAWRRERKQISFYDQDKQLKEIRASGDVGIASFKVASDVLRRVDLAFQAFYRRVKAGQKPGYPRFRSRVRYDSLATRYGDGMFVRGDRLHVRGVGPIRFKQHRTIVGDGRTIQVKRDAGKWFVVIVTEQAQQVPLPEVESSVGIDVGLSSFATLSNGESVAAPQHYRASEAKLRRAQRHLARCRRGSNGRRSALSRVRTCHRAVRNRREDFAHKLSRQIVNAHGSIAVESLNVSGMARSRRFSKSIHDAAWSSFLDKVAYKAENAGRRFVKVDARGTSQSCLCGASVPKVLKQRWHHCPECGLSAPRDVVSAQVIELRGRRRQTPTEPLGAVVCGAVLGRTSLLAAETLPGGSR